MPFLQSRSRLKPRRRASQCLFTIDPNGLCGEKRHMVRLPTLNVNWSRDRVYVIRRGVVACCILFCLIGAGVETAAAQRSWPRADTATAAATAAANEPTAVTRKQVPDSGKQGGSRKTQNTQNGDDKAAQSVDWKGPTGKQPDLSQYSDLSVEVSLAKQRVYVKSGGQTIYTMIASTGVDDATPHGSYTIDTRGSIVNRHCDALRLGFSRDLDCRNGIVRGIFARRRHRPAPPQQHPQADEAQEPTGTVVDTHLLSESLHAVGNPARTGMRFDDGET
jgi:hypothetical protein